MIYMCVYYDLSPGLTTFPYNSSGVCDISETTRRTFLSTNNNCI